MFDLRLGFTKIIRGDITATGTIQTDALSTGAVLKCQITI
jgi:hypothetical protein